MGAAKERRHSTGLLQYQQSLQNAVPRSGRSGRSGSTVVVVVRGRPVRYWYLLLFSCLCMILYDFTFRDLELLSSNRCSWVQCMGIFHDFLFVLTTLKSDAYPPLPSSSSQSEPLKKFPTPGRSSTWWLHDLIYRCLSQIG